MKNVMEFFPADASDQQITDFFARFRKQNGFEAKAVQVETGSVVENSTPAVCTILVSGSSGQQGDFANMAPDAELAEIRDYYTENKKDK